METFYALLVICAGNSAVTGEFPTQRPVTRSFDVFFDLNGWINNREAGDLRRHRAHYDVTVMIMKGMVNYIHISIRNVTSHQILNFHGGLANPILKLYALS